MHLSQGLVSLAIHVNFNYFPKDFSQYKLEGFTMYFQDLAIYNFIVDLFTVSKLSLKDCISFVSSAYSSDNSHRELVFRISLLNY